MAKSIGLMTSNARKLEEYKQRFRPYGIRVRQLPKTPEAVSGWLEDKKTVAVLRERSNLFGPDGAPLEDPPHLQVASNRTTLTAWTRGEAGLVEQTWERCIEGFVDRTRRRHAADEDVFDWDDLFVMRETGRTYHEMRLRNLKLSARDLVIADFATEHVWYDDPIALRWSELEGERTIDFGVDPRRFIENHPYYGRLEPETPLRRVLDHVLAQGLFFRSARNRREKNYWLPGLNAGIPLVPKRDDVHEATFMFHDLMHFAFPDLLFDGDGSEVNRRVYVAHRMMSEATTLCLADMAFATAMKRSGVDYDFSPRHILPLFESMGLDPASPDDLATTLHANARYCLLGDDSAYRALGADTNALAAFRGKYEQYFIADYTWTRRNFASMAERMGPAARAWLRLTAPIRESLPVEMLTISELRDSLDVDTNDPEALVEAIFGGYLARLQQLTTTPADPSTCLEHGFKRYMTGQLALTITFDFLPASALYARRLVDELSRLSETWDLARVQRLRAFFDQYVALLRDRHLVSDEDARIYRELYPFFAPSYVAYDVPPQGDLAEVARQVLR